MPITIARPRGGAPDSAATPLELVCPAGSLPALKAAIDNGADCVYLGFRDAINFYHQQFGDPTCGIATCAVHRAGGAGYREDPGGNRGIRLWQPVCDG